MNCILIGLPIWFVVGILIIFSPEFGLNMGIKEPVNAGTAVMYCYLGLGIGDFLSGYLSQLLKNRKKIVFVYLILTLVCVPFYLYATNVTPDYIYFMSLLLGIAAGYWAVFITIASEQFGTNIRSTVTTSVPNFVRGGVVPLTLTFNFLKDHVGIINSAIIVGISTLIIAFYSLSGLSETYGKDLDYLEIDKE